MHYPTAVKARMIKKLTGPAAISANALAKESGICQGTLSRWVREAATVGQPMSKPEDLEKRTERKRAQDWTAAEKLQIVMEASNIGEEELGALLRRRGLHRVQLEEWRTQALSGLEPVSTKRQGRSKTTEEQKRIRELEREIRRKDRALAETAALLVLKKKAQAIWGDADEDTDPKSGG
jgi:transposase